MPTYTNLVILQGWLEIETVSVTLFNRVQVPVLNGWIYTTDQTGLEDCFDECHPVCLDALVFLAGAVLDDPSAWNNLVLHGLLVTLLLRIRWEEQVVYGYPAYAGRVRWRLILLSSKSFSMRLS